MTNILYYVHMVASKNDIYATFYFFIFFMVDPAYFFFLCMDSCKSFAIWSCSIIRNLTVEVVAFAESLETSTMTFRYLLTSSTITLYSVCAGDVWSSRRCFLHHKILSCDFSNSRLYISVFRSSSSRKTSSWSFEIGCDSRGSKYCGAILDALSMRLQRLWCNLRCPQHEIDVLVLELLFWLHVCFLSHLLNMQSKFLDMHLLILFIIS